jgi:cobalamin-dependent methionine synthase I
MWLVRFPENERARASEAMQLHKEAQRMLSELDAQYQTHGVYQLMEANSEGNDIWIEGTRLPLLRQQATRPGEPYLCLSDFIRPLASGIPDKIGIFATSVDKEMESLYPDDGYKHMLVQTLADRLAEATAEKLHESIRKETWGFAPDEHLTIKQMHNEEFQGIRPAVGYPSLPDQSINFLLDDLLDMKQIGITLTENGMMQPHASISGMIFAHPASRYFSVGKIDEIQLEDYARRRNLPLETMKKYLSSNL